MTRPQFILDLNNELIVDNFAGGGGASTGIAMALGRHVDHAINHDAFALGMHRINHPQTVHHCEDVFDVDPLKLTQGRPVGLGWFSPDCKHFSKAKGGKPLSKKIRGLAFVILRWAKIRTRVIAMENVEEIQTWGPLLHARNHKADCDCGKPCGRPDPAHKGRTWRAFLDALGAGVSPDHPDLDEMLEVLGNTVTKDELVHGFGYESEVRELRAFRYGSPTIRKRLFLLARCDGRPIVWPQETHAEPDKRKPGQKPWRIVAECLDLGLPCPSIFLTREQARVTRCKRPLAKSTMRRIAAGVDRYVLKAAKPFIVSLTQRTFPPDGPLRTQCGEVKGGHFALVAPVLARTAHGDQDSKGKKRGRGSHPVTEPNPTTLASQDLGLISANLVVNTTGHPGAPADAPAPTIPTGGHHAVVATTLIQTGYGEREGQQPRVPGIEKPLGTVVAGAAKHAVVAASMVKLLSTISSKGAQQQVVSASLAAYYGCETDGQGVSEPLRTVTTKERFGLAMSQAVAPVMTAEQIAGAHRVAQFLRDHGVQFDGEFATVGPYVIVDIGIRMLTPRELFRAQGFPEQYVIDRAWLINPATGDLKEVVLTKEAQIRMCGNSVCPDVAAAIVRSNVPELAVWSKAEQRKRKEVHCTSAP